MGTGSLARRVILGAGLLGVVILGAERANNSGQMRAIESSPTYQLKKQLDSEISTIQRQLRSPIIIEDHYITEEKAKIQLDRSLKDKNYLQERGKRLVKEYNEKITSEHKAFLKAYESAKQNYKAVSQVYSGFWLTAIVTGIMEAAAYLKRKGAYTINKKKKK
jgi:hypothetical protein